MSRGPRGSARMLTRPSVPTPFACLAVAVLTTVAACGSNPKLQTNPAVPEQTAAPVSPVPVTAAPVDPVASLIAASQEHFATGERELKLGHLDRARVEFDRAVDLLLESPY